MNDIAIRYAESKLITTVEFNQRKIPQFYATHLMVLLDMLKTEMNK